VTQENSLVVHTSGNARYLSNIFCGRGLSLRREDQYTQCVVTMQRWPVATATARMSWPGRQGGKPSTQDDRGGIGSRRGGGFVIPPWPPPPNGDHKDDRDPLPPRRSLMALRRSGAPLTRKGPWGGRRQSHPLTASYTGGISWQLDPRELRGILLAWGREGGREVPCLSSGSYSGQRWFVGQGESRRRLSFPSVISMERPVGGWHDGWIPAPHPPPIHQWEEQGFEDQGLGLNTAISNNNQARH
jgi:hypothetical protein